MEPESKQNKQIIRKVDREYLVKAFDYSESSQWRNYIINLESKPEGDYFDCENPLYKYTPRILKCGTSFGIEKLARRRVTETDYTALTEKVAQEVLASGIAVSRLPEDLYIIEENENVIIKFARFTLLFEEDNENG